MPQIDKLDFYTIFGNVLENAIEHCDGDKVKSISLDVGTTFDQRYYFKIRNSIAENHGYGVSSIVKLVKKHNGYVDFIKKDKSFSVIVILP